MARVVIRVRVDGRKDVPNVGDERAEEHGRHGRCPDPHSSGLTKAGQLNQQSPRSGGRGGRAGRYNRLGLPGRCLIDGQAGTRAARLPRRRAVSLRRPVAPAATLERSARALPHRLALPRLRQGLCAGVHRMGRKGVRRVLEVLRSDGPVPVDASTGAGRAYRST